MIDTTNEIFPGSSKYAAGPYGLGVRVPMMVIQNRGGTFSRVRVSDYYTRKATEHELRPDETIREFWPLEESHGWYDFTIETESDIGFQRRLAGHLETGYDSMSDPAFGAAKHPEQAESSQTRTYASTK